MEQHADMAQAHVHLGTFAGHVLPGTLFLILGAWWCARWLRTGTTASLESRAVYLLVPPLAVAGAIGELWWASWRMVDSSVINYQHATMYLAFGAAGVVAPLALRGTVPRSVPALFLAGAFGITGLLFAAHGAHGVVSAEIHRLLALLLAGTAIVTAYEAFRPSRAAGIARTYGTLLIGGWFWQAAWLLYRSNLDLDAPAVVMRVHLFFVWQALAVAGLIVVLYVVNARVRPGGSRRYGSAPEAGEV